jgi:hypothetical protein
MAPSYDIMPDGELRNRHLSGVGPANTSNANSRSSCDEDASKKALLEGQDHCKSCKKCLCRTVADGYDYSRCNCVHSTTQSFTKSQLDATTTVIALTAVVSTLVDGLGNYGPVLSMGAAAASGMAFLFSNSSNNEQFALAEANAKLRFALAEANAKLRDLEAKKERLEERLAMMAMKTSMDAFMKKLESIQTSENSKQDPATEEPKGEQEKEQSLWQARIVVVNRKITEVKKDISELEGKTPSEAGDIIV